MIPNVVSWDVSPILLELYGISIRWYSLFFAFAFLGGYYIVKFYTKEWNISDKVYDYWLLYMLVGALVGARLGHCFFYEFSYYSNNPLEIFKIWKGGMASHGGAIGLLISLFIFSKKFKLQFIWILDKIAAVIALGGSFLRLGNLMNSEIYGYPTDQPWGFIFVNAKPPEFVPRHPTQLYESICYFTLFLILHFVDKKYEYKSPKGMLISILLIGIFGARFCIEFLKESQVNFENYMPLNMGQWLSIPFVFSGIIFLFYIRKNNIKTDKYV